MTDGSRWPVPAETLFVDCTASAVDFKHPKTLDVFAPGAYYDSGPSGTRNPCLSAALTAYVEVNFENDQRRNELCRPVTIADDPAGWARSTLGNMLNQGTWSTEPAMAEWITNCRLDGFAAVIRDADRSDPGKRGDSRAPRRQRGARHRQPPAVAGDL